MSMAQARANWLTLLPPFTWTGSFVACLVLLLSVPTVQSLFTSWQNNPDYSHGWLLLPVVAWLFVRAQPWNLVTQPMLGLGSVTILAGGAIHLATQVIPWPLIDYAGWVLLLRGLALSLWGRSAAQRLMPVLAYGVLLFPLPMVWLNDLAMLLQDVIAKVAEWGLSLLWVCHRRGHQLYLAGLEEPLSVAVECSGVRQLMMFLALSWLLAFSLRGSFWRRLALVAASVPLAIIANVLRVLALAILARLMGPSTIQGLLHELPLLLTLPLGAILLWWYYCRLQTGTVAGLFGTPNDPASHSPIATQTGSSGVPHDPATGSGRSTAITLGVLLLLQFMLQYHLGSIVKAHHVNPLDLDSMPWQLGSWKGMPHPEADKVKQQAAFADASLIRAYADNQGRAVAVYLVFSATGQDRMHHPEICLRDAGGALELKADRQNIPLQADAQRQAQRFRYQRQRQERTLVYYWHYTMMPNISPEQSVLQRLYLKQHDQWPSVTVQVQTNMTDPAAWKAIETTLLPELDSWLTTQIPAGAQVGSGRLPVRFTNER